MTRNVGNPPPPGAIVPIKLFDELRSLSGSDTGNSEAFELLYGHRLRYDHSRKRWMVWTGRAWVLDADGEAERAAIDTARWRSTARSLALPKEMDRYAEKSFKEYFDAAADAESVYGIRSTLEIAKNLRRIATVTTDYDRDPFLLTCGNGTLDLRTGELRPAWAEDLITRATHIHFDSSARCSRWIQFLGEVFACDCDLIDFIQRAVG
jgi:putative DNA primase/helicase